MKKHEPMTEERLLAIKARAEAATPGPFKVFYRALDFHSGFYESLWAEGQKEVICAVSHGKNDRADAEFLAHAREDVPALLAEVERLRAEVKSLNSIVESMSENIASLDKELEFSDETEYDLIKKLFDLKICHKEWICEQDGSSELNFEGENGCHFCWRKWAIMKARKEVDEEGIHE